MVEVLSHLAGKVGGGVGVVPRHVLLQHCLEQTQRFIQQIMTFFKPKFIVGVPEV
jgi:hypothetical protein